MVSQMQSVSALETGNNMQKCSRIRGAMISGRTAAVRQRTLTARSVALVLCSLRKLPATTQVNRTPAKLQKTGSMGRMVPQIVEQQGHGGPGSAALFKPRRMSSLLRDVVVRSVDTESIAPALQADSQFVAARRMSQGKRFP